MAAANGTPEPRLRQFTVGGVFQAGLEEHDNSLILAQIDDVRAFAPLAQGASGLRLRFTDALQVAQFMPAVRAAAGRRLSAAATGRRTTPATFARSASRRP